LRGELLTPGEVFTDGTIRVPDAPGFGVALNEKAARAHPI
jgi:L-alanine-DL-glutamate epimerase-like enolase superfamily enzyme